VRIAEGATYSPSAGASESDTFPGYGLVFAGVEIPPARTAGFYADASAIADALRTKGITADELSRAVRPHVEAIQKAQQTNGYWLSMLHRAQEEPRRLTLIRDTTPAYLRMTADEVNAVARQYLRPETAWRYQVAPASGQAGAMAAPKPAT
jgi:zinc protease